MQVDAKLTRYEKVDVSKSNLIDAVIEIIRKKAELRYDVWLKDGKLAYWEEHYHGSDTLKYLREATPDEVKALKVISYLEDLKRSS